MPRVRAVTLSATFKQTCMVCCKNNGNQKGVSAKPLCRFKSSLSGWWYLSFEAGPDAELLKLVLREVPDDVVDERCYMDLQNHGI
ncbi:unnamed protein product, partial [Coregonus sp. 'balchen']